MKNYYKNASLFNLDLFKKDSKNKKRNLKKTKKKLNIL